MNKDLVQKAQHVIDYAKSQGAQCDVILSKGESFSVSCQNEDIDKYSLSGSQIMGIRTIKDQKVGISYSESFDDEALNKMVDMAIETSKFNSLNEFEQIAKETGEKFHNIEIIKDKATTDEKIQLCLSLETEVKKRDSRVQAVPYNGFADGSSEFYYLNSNGLVAFDQDYYQSCYTSALITNGQENSMHYKSCVARTLKELDSESCITESLEHASNWLGAKPIQTGHYDVVFNADQLPSFFGCFSGIFSAKAAQDKLNPMAEKLDSIIAHPELSILDMPLYGQAFSKSYFDSEGLNQKDLSLIENGKLSNFMHNTATASFFKTDSNARASRGAKGALGVSGTTYVIQEGSEKTPLSGEYIELCSLQGLHSGANFMSGDFSFGASGYLCRDGKRITPIKGITVAGNFYKMLKDIKCIGDEIKSNSSLSFFSPVIRFNQVSIAGS